MTPGDRSAYSSQRRRTLLGCILAQNLMIGLSYGTFGALLEQNQTHFDVGRTTMTAAMSFISLTLALGSSLAGSLIPRFRPRDLMLTGIAIAAVAYAGLVFTTAFWQALICFTMIGTGVAFSAIISPVALITRWFPEGPGKPLGLVHLPILMLSVPFVSGLLLDDVGRAGIYAGVAGLLLLALPVLAVLIRNPPAEAADGSVSGANPADGVVLGIGVLLRSPSFWLISLAIGLLAGSGTVAVVHLVPFGMERGLPQVSAAALLSVFAAAGLFGTPLFGRLADRIGALNALALSAALAGLMWTMLPFLMGNPIFFAVALLGAASSPLVALHGASVRAVFGPVAAARAMGYGYLVKLPFLFGFPIIAALLFEITGNYRLPYLLCGMSLACATICAIGVTVLRLRAGGPAIADPAAQAA